MIEDYPAKRRRSRAIARLLFALGVILATLAGVAAFFYVSRGEPPSLPPDSGVAVVIAARELPPRTTLAVNDVRIATLPRNLVPDGAFTEVSAVVGRITTERLAANELLLGSRFAGSERFTFGVFPAGQQPTGNSPDFRAMSIGIPEAQAVGGALQPGDIVDVVTAFSYEPGVIGPEASPSIDYAARIVAERVTVLARAGSTYTLRVDAQLAERIAALQAGGAALHLILRAGDDIRVPRASGAIFSTEAGGIIRLIPSPLPSPR